MNEPVIQWAIRNNISWGALAELREMFQMDAPAPEPGRLEHSEAYVQSEVRLEAGRAGVKLWRNNVGVLPGPNGVPVRYGLANDSRVLNAAIKSADLIGWRSILIEQKHVGRLIAQFVSRECKRPGWNYTGTDHEKAQARWMQAIIADGGDASFVTGKGTL